MKIILGTFKEEGEELAEFLEPRIGAKPQVGGGELTVDDDSLKSTVRSRHVKTYVKRFLWKKGERKNYRVLVEGKELRLIELEPTEAEEEERKKLEEREEARKKEEPVKEEEEAEGVEKEEVLAPQPEPPSTPPPAEVPAAEEKKPAAKKESKRKTKKSDEKEQPAAAPST